jgi:hypothetical protein
MAAFGTSKVGDHAEDGLLYVSGHGAGNEGSHFPTATTAAGDYIQSDIFTLLRTPCLLSGRKARAPKLAWFAKVCPREIESTCLSPFPRFHRPQFVREVRDLIRKE